ncbi:MAG TPA: adenylate/guanylate cyclase domain-containing protein [Acidimicrobiia bacterium]|nr:adenylate/guanylate cyclase domain-containing protein [Acidimicrobiia bacterium]
MDSSTLPTGTVTFLFTDIEGSTRLVQATGDAWLELLERHNRLLRSAIEEHGGTVVKTEGDGFFAVFGAADEALAAAADAQRELRRQGWPADAPIRVRMGLHTGHGTIGGDDYVGLDVHRAARIAGTGHGGQTVLSEATAVLAENSLPQGLTLRDAGKHRLKDLTQPETLFELVIDGIDETFPPLRTLDAVPNNLPLQLTSFVGRRDELTEARRLLQSSRLLTLTGPGGTGKTRLALQVGAEASGDFADGVFFVDLAPVSDVAVVPSAILGALGIQEPAGDYDPGRHLGESLSDKQLLMILDNFEQILGAAPLVGEMVRASPRSKFLVTSRAPLRLSAEQEMPLAPMPLPQAGIGLEPLCEFDAVKLFVERAMGVRPDFRLDDDNAEAVSELVRRLDGLPLAIELIASRVRLLPVATIAERFDPGMLSGAVDLPDRQRTIDGAIAWSYDLLEEPEKELFARLSVFAGGGRLDEIEKVCGSGTDLLERLAVLLDQSLIRRIDSEQEPRFRMLQVIREFAARCLDGRDERDQIHDRHLLAYTEMAEDAVAQLKGPQRKRWLNLLERDHDNIRAALEWATATDQTDLALRLSFACWRFWQARGHLFEAGRRLEAALALPGGDPRLRAKALEGLGGVLWWQSRTDEFLEVYKRVLAMQREIDDPAEIANALYNHALGLGFAGYETHSRNEVNEEALANLDEAEEIYRRLDDPDGLGDVYWGRGNLLGILGGDLEGGLSQWQRSKEYYEQAGNHFGLGWALFELALLSRTMGDIDTAWSYLRQGLAMFAEHEDVSAAVLFMALAGELALDAGDETRGVRLGGAFQALRIQSGADIVSHASNRIEELSLERLEALTGPLREAYMEGRAMTYADAVAYALAGPTDTDAR